MKKLIYCTIILFVFVSSGVAQDDDNASGGGSFWSKCAVGGNFSLQFGNITYIDISPALIYHANDRLSIGVGPIYQFLRLRDYWYIGQDDRYNTYGGRIFSRYVLFEELLSDGDLFAHAEYQYLNVDAYDELFGGSFRTDVNVFLVGGGFRQRLGLRSFLYIGVLYDIIQDRNSPYYNRPVYQIGFGIGL